MIQRIQSIYLLAAAFLTGITAFCPIVRIESANGLDYISLMSIGIDTNVQEFAGYHPWYMLCTWALCVIAPIIAIFRFKNRKKQIKWAIFACIVNILFILTVIETCISLVGRFDGTPKPQICALMPILSAFFTILARNGIRHDEALVRAADRIR